MGRGRRLQPKKLKNKLRHIRTILGLTQEQIAKNLRAFTPKASIHPGHISQFESGQREPQLPVLLGYAKMMGISTDVLIDDELDLPVKLPSRPKLKVERRSAK
jgi:transcriptional regulator with XRE-family HTH domain